MNLTTHIGLVVIEALKWLIRMMTIEGLYNVCMHENIIKLLST